VTPRLKSGSTRGPGLWHDRCPCGTTLVVVAWIVIFPVMTLIHRRS
jgi:hypothetical protein